MFSKSEASLNQKHDRRDNSVYIEKERGGGCGKIEEKPNMANSHVVMF